ncbi:MAG: hypothetical protein IJV01_04240 [Bacteroidales bacterium]|nr:hypothetical protein [Bacteroidales bacterium]
MNDEKMQLVWPYNPGWRTGLQGFLEQEMFLLGKVSSKVQEKQEGRENGIICSAVIAVLFVVYIYLINSL